MDIKQIENLIAAIKKNCPYDVSIVPTKHRKLLLIVNYSSQNINLDNWAVSLVHPLHWNKIYPLIEKEGHPITIRSLYFCDDKFVLYTPDFGPDILSNVDFPIQYESYGYESRHKYVGNCANVKQLITFLKEKAPRFGF